MSETLRSDSGDSVWFGLAPAARHWPALDRLKLILSWLIPLGFLAWATRVAVLEGYLYQVGDQMVGDFTRTARFGSPEFWTGSGMFYGPVFVLESLLLIAPGRVSDADFALLDFALYLLAFLCAWVALVGAKRIRLALFVLAAWVGHHASVEAFANTAHLEVLELACLCAALLLVVRGRPVAAGSTLGLAIATKTLPGLFVPYLAITRQWRILIGALVVFAAFFLTVCWLQGITPLQGANDLIVQGGNLTKMEFREYEYTPRADIARILSTDGVSLSEDQTRLAIELHFMLAALAAAIVAWVLLRAPRSERVQGLMFGLIAALMLIASPSVHLQYYVFLLLTWTAVLIELLRRPLTRLTVTLWLGLAAGYVFTGFDQPFFLMQRLFGFGLVVPQHWLPWHLPTLALLLTFGVAFDHVEASVRGVPTSAVFADHVVTNSEGVHLCADEAVDGFFGSTYDRLVFDAAMAKRARSPLHPSLEPADYVARRDQLRCPRAQCVVIQLGVAQTRCVQRAGDATAAELRTRVRRLHE